jgi:hypothetical protein
MVKCKDGRKHVVVKGYERKNGEKIPRHERSCPEPTSQNDWSTCCVCGEESTVNKLQVLEIKGETKKICNECLDSIHGLV